MSWIKVSPCCLSCWISVQLLIQLTVDPELLLHRFEACFDIQSEAKDGSNPISAIGSKWSAQNYFTMFQSTK